MIIEIQKGDNTQTQLHVMILHNFKTINTMVNNPVNPIPVVLVV